MSTCQIHNRYSWIECQHPIWPSDPEGFCILHSQDKEKDQAAFDAALKEKLAREDYDFRGVFFPGPVSFERYEFKKDADFSGATFSGEANFLEATFSGEADFFGATFSGEADFSGATFSGRADFSGATFSGEADFSEATFSGEADFFEVAFSGWADFSWAAISGRVIFRSLDIQEKSESHPPPFIGDFICLEIKNQAVLRFQDLSLAQVKFSGTDLRRLEFHNVTWHRRRGRDQVYDEVLLKNVKPKPSAEDYARVEELYRYLKLNYEGKGDHKKAGDFHYGEMEMHRRASKWRGFPLYWYNLYRFLSGYGERPLRALGWLALFLFGISGLVWWRGLEILNPQQLGGFGDSFIYILQKATLQRPEWAKPSTYLGQLLSSLSPLLLPGQAALFILALRNRLGRRR